MPVVSDLTSHTGYLLRMVSNAVSHEFARKVAESGVTVAEWVMLRSIYGVAAVSPSALARTMGMTRGAISKLSDRLVEKGLVVRAGHPGDRRSHTLSLSAAGAMLVPLLAGLADDNDGAFFTVLSGEEHEQLRHLLQILIRRHRLSTVPVE